MHLKSTPRPFCNDGRSPFSYFRIGASLYKVVVNDYLIFLGLTYLKGTSCTLPGPLRKEGRGDERSGIRPRSGLSEFYAIKVSWCHKSLRCIFMTIYVP